MQCAEVSALLPQLLAGTLDRESEALALEHLAGCGDCRRELALWARVAEAAREAAPEMPEEAFAAAHNGLFGGRKLSVIDSLRLTGRALGLAGSACRLALSAAGAK